MQATERSAKTAATILIHMVTVLVATINYNGSAPQYNMNELLIKPLEAKVVEYSEWIREERPHLIKVYERVLFFDPKDVYKRIEALIDPLKRHQGIGMENLFPKIEIYCACGCGEKAIASNPPGSWQRKWASDECASFAGDVLSIINNYFGKPAKYISLYHGNKCSECEETCDLQLDHIVGVKQGGGGCWLSNYRWLCRKHHVDKTNKDFKRKNYK